MTILLNHPVLLAVLILSFFATVLTYRAPFFVSDNLVISQELNLGTFCGTLTHKDWGHWVGNVILLIPFWIYLDNKLGKAFVIIVVLFNMFSTGLYGLLSSQCLCGLSGIVFMLIGIAGIVGNWLFFFFAVVMFGQEFCLLGAKDETCHGAHIVFFILGIVIGLLKIILPLF